MASEFAFIPHYGSGQTISIAINGTGNTPIDGTDQAICITNTGTQLFHLRTYSSLGATPTASATDYPVPATSQLIISKSETHDRLAYFNPSGTIVVAAHIMTGEGL